MGNIIILQHNTLWDPKHNDNLPTLDYKKKKMALQLKLETKNTTKRHRCYYLLY